MLAIEISFSVLWLPAIVALSAILGFLARGRQSAKKKRQILSLENEMLKNHAEILKLQKELADLQKLLPTNKTRIVSMKETSNEDKAENPEASTQRKLAN